MYDRQKITTQLAYSSSFPTRKAGEERSSMIGALLSKGFDRVSRSEENTAAHHHGCAVSLQRSKTRTHTIEMIL